MRSPQKQTSEAVATRAAGYVRVSTDDQARNGLSLEEQERQLREAAGDDLRLFVDAGISGATTNRPEYQALLAAAATGELEVVYVWKLDRLGRDAEELLRARRMLGAAGVRLVSLTEGEDESTLVFGVRALVAQEEREKIAQRTSMGLLASARKGIWHGPAPLGYRWVGLKAERRMVIDEATAPIVRTIFERYIDGKGIAKLATSLDADGIAPPRGKLWDPHTVRNVLGCVAYVGRVKFNGEDFPGVHESILDPDTWERAQLQLLSRRTGKTWGQRPNGTHLLIGGLLRCGCCGAGMRPRTPKGRQPRYDCTTRDRGRACDMRGILASEIDRPLLDYLESVVFDLDVTRQAITEERDRRISESQALIAQADLASTKADEALTRIRADYVAGKISAEDWASLREELESGREASDSEADQLRRRASEIEREAQTLDVEGEIAHRLAELRLAVAGEITGAEGLEPIRSALARVFEHVSLVRTDDGLVLVPQVRLPAEISAWVALGDQALVQASPAKQPVPRISTERTRSRLEPRAPRAPPRGRSRP